MPLPSRLKVRQVTAFFFFFTDAMLKASLFEILLVKSKAKYVIAWPVGCPLGSVPKADRLHGISVEQHLSPSSRFCFKDREWTGNKINKLQHVFQLNGKSYCLRKGSLPLLHVVSTNVSTG